MNGSGRSRLRLMVMALTGVALLAPASGQTTPAATTPAPAATTTPAAAKPATTSAPAKKITVDELLPRESVTLNFNDVPIRDVLAAMGEKYGFDVRNAYDFPVKADSSAEADRSDQMKMTVMGAKMTARQSINLMNSLLLPLGYSLGETVRGDPPRVVLTVLQTGVDTTKIHVYFGQDPAAIPEGEEQRTQVMTLVKADPAQAKEDLETMLGTTKIDITQGTRQLVITDTATHVKQAAGYILLMEKKADKGNK